MRLSEDEVNDVIKTANEILAKAEVVCYYNYKSHHLQIEERLSGWVLRTHYIYLRTNRKDKDHFLNLILMSVCKNVNMIARLRGYFV